MIGGPIFSKVGYARGVSLLVVLSVNCAAVTFALKIYGPEAEEVSDEVPVH